MSLINRDDIIEHYPPSNRRVPTPEEVGQLRMATIGEFNTTLSAIESLIRRAWGIESDLRLQYPHDLTLDVAPILSTTAMKQRANKVRNGKYCRDLPFLLRVACVDDLIPVGRYHIRAE